MRPLIETLEIRGAWGQCGAFRIRRGALENGLEERALQNAGRSHGPTIPRNRPKEKAAPKPKSRIAAAIHDLAERLDSPDLDTENFAIDLVSKLGTKLTLRIKVEPQGVAEPHPAIGGFLQLQSHLLTDALSHTLNRVKPVGGPHEKRGEWRVDDSRNAALGDDPTIDVVFEKNADVRSPGAGEMSHLPVDVTPAPNEDEISGGETIAIFFGDHGLIRFRPPETYHRIYHTQ